MAQTLELQAAELQRAFDACDSKLGREAIGAALTTTDE